MTTIVLMADAAIPSLGGEGRSLDNPGVVARDESGPRYTTNPPRMQGFRRIEERLFPGALLARPFVTPSRRRGGGRPG